MRPGFLIPALLLLSVWSCKKDKVFDSALTQRQFTSQALQNNAIGDPALRRVMVYTPPGYDPDGTQRYPVVYLLHGVPFGDSAFIDKNQWDAWIDPNGVFNTYPDFPAEGFQKWIDGLIATGKMEETIIVMPDSKTSYYFSFYTNSALLGNYENYIANDLVNFIDANYHTIADKDGRAVIGFSQGGYGAMMLGMKHPGIFGTVAAHSAPLVFEGLKAMLPYMIAENPNGMNGPAPDKFLTSTIYAMSAAWSPNVNNPPFYVDLPFEYPSGTILTDVWNRWLEHDPLTLAPGYTDNLRSLHGLYFDVGQQDQFAFNLTYDYFDQELSALGVTHTYQTFSGGHFDKMYARLEISLSFCSNSMNH